jgi:predicted MFS family arabinose efflux permease
MGLLLMGNLTFPVLMVSAFAASLTYPYIMPSRTAMLMDAVGRPALGKANAMMGAGVSVARMVSPAVIGLLADLGGTLWAYYLLLFIHLATIFCTFSLNENRSSQHSGESFLNDAKAGFVYMFRHQPLALCILYGLLPTLLVVPLQNLLVVFVDEVWDQGGSGLGILMAAMGMGGLLGSVAMGQIRDDSLAKPMAISTLALAFFVLLFSHSPSFWLATVLMLGIYACSVLCQTLVHTAVQLMTEDSVRGRISTITMMTYGLAPIGTIPLAYGAKRIGAPWAMSIGALLLAVVVVYVWYRVENFRRIDQAAREHR